MQFQTNREYLNRATSLGMRHLYVSSPSSHLICRDAHRIYLWALLGKDGAIEPTVGAVRIELGKVTVPQKE